MGVRVFVDRHVTHLSGRQVAALEVFGWPAHVNQCRPCLWQLNVGGGGGRRGGRGGARMVVVVVDNRAARND